MSYEEQFGIVEEPPYTCPMIDIIINELDCIKSNIQGYRSLETIEELTEIISLIESTVDGTWPLQDTIEEIRTNVDNLRKWGEQWKQTAIELNKKLQEFES
jgi:hypothetical protein